ncbi:hypothetical protein GN109_19280 [Collimonas pratensis]|uniref:hypothetical protein n=1 Tax=Collimonas pratensis TaxID=279113 RepID=UPI00143D6336|nr:hypothetical protein [Collimonas pratensis]NKI71573.1 hypothetical protein [Collimonas pratensis]
MSDEKLRCFPDQPICLLIDGNRFDYIARPVYCFCTLQLSLRTGFKKILLWEVLFSVGGGGYVLVGLVILIVSAPFRGKPNNEKNRFFFLVKQSQFRHLIRSLDTMQEE